MNINIATVFRASTQRYLCVQRCVVDGICHKSQGQTTYRQEFHVNFNWKYSITPTQRTTLTTVLERAHCIPADGGARSQSYSTLQRTDYSRSTWTRPQRGVGVISFKRFQSLGCCVLPFIIRKITSLLHNNCTKLSHSLRQITMQLFVCSDMKSVLYMKMQVRQQGKNIKLSFQEDRLLSCGTFAHPKRPCSLLLRASGAHCRKVVFRFFILDFSSLLVREVNAIIVGLNSHLLKDSSECSKGVSLLRPEKEVPWINPLNTFTHVYTSTPTQVPVFPSTRRAILFRGMLMLKTWSLSLL